MVLLRDGLTGCTARAVADASPLTKSAIHYYFDDMDEIVELAMDSLLDEFLTAVRLAGEGQGDPVARFFAMTEAYLRAFTERPGYALLWFGYWVQTALEGRRERMLRLQSTIVGVIEEVLQQAGIDDAPTRARAVFSYLVGAVVRQEAEPAELSQLTAELSGLIGLRPEPAP